MAWKNIEDKRKYMREYNKNFRADRKRLGLCTLCGKEDAFYPFRRCPACMEKNALRNIRYENNLNAKVKEKIRISKQKSAQKKVQNRKTMGLCPMCGKRKPAEGKKHCERCLIKMRAYSHAYRLRKSGEQSVPFA